VNHRPRLQVYWRSTGRGPALVLLNGWSASGLAWPRRWVRELEDRFRVIRIDNRGSGYSRFVDTPFTMADLADDVAAVLDDAEVGGATVLGMSMGGMVAQEFAMRHPDRTDALVLVATRPPAPAFGPVSSTDGMWHLLMPPRRGEGLEPYFERLWASAVGAGFAEREPHLIAELVAQVVERPTPRQLLVHQLRAVNGWGHAERLGRIGAPTAVVHGAEDTFVHVVNGRTLAELIPGARLVELPGVGHLPALEAPDELRDAIGSVAPAAVRA
jgi:3-oxoadipate enol-lactonase